MGSGTDPSGLAPAPPEAFYTSDWRLPEGAVEMLARLNRATNTAYVGLMDGKPEAETLAIMVEVAEEAVA